MVVGLATDYCVSATALDAARLGFGTEVLQDAIAAVDLAEGDGDRAPRRDGGRRLRARVLLRHAALSAMRVHLVDATYELFRAHYAPRPPTLGRDGVNLSGVAGLVDQLLYLLREEGATHVGCATDRVIESFRNDMFPGYKSSAGMPPELLRQFPIAEQAIGALGLVLWPMVEFEADDAIAAACVRFAADPAVEQVLICTPDKDMAQLVRDERVVLLDRRRRITYDEAGVHGEVGRAPDRDPRLARARRRFIGRLPGAARLGREVRRRGAGALRLPRGDPAEGLGVGRARACAARSCWPRRCASAGTRCCCIASLARLRTTDDGVVIPEQTVGELQWRGTPRAGVGGVLRGWVCRSTRPGRTAGARTDG